MSLRIILAPLRRRGLMPAIVFLQVALACAILCNVFFLAWQRLEPMLTPAGVDAHNLILIDNLAPVHGTWSEAESQAAEQAFRNVPGVRDASSGLGLPMVSIVTIEFNLQGPTKSAVGVNAYAGRGLIDTLGLQRVAGRDFLPEEYRPFGVGASNGHNADWDAGAPQPVIITQALADKLFGNAQPVGGLLGDPSDKDVKGYQVVGIVKHLLRNELGLATNGHAEYTMLLARNIGNTAMLSYAIRVDPTMHEAAMRGIKEAVKRQFGARTENGPQARVEWYDDKRNEAFKSSRATLWLLLGLVVAVIMVTLAGIMGLTGFWVQQRTRQIGVRRALGARRIDILHYFLAENVLIVGAGVIVGMGLAYLGNAMLMRYYELPHLPWIYLPVGATAMLLMGQLSALAPAMRAAAVSPVVATRSL
jgi:putative ABC transport system permease protein